MEPSDLEAALQRRGRVVEALLEVNRVCAALPLNDRAATCDTLINLVASLVDVRCAAIVLTHEIYLGRGMPTPGGIRQAPLFGKLLDGRGGRLVEPAEIEEEWPWAPPSYAVGFAAATIDIGDRPIGVFLASEPATQFHPEDVQLITGCAGIAALSLANCDLHAAREHALDDAKRQAEAAQRIADERERALALVSAQQQEIHELSTPILHVWDHTVAVPLTGTLDAARSSRLTEKLLHTVTGHGIRNVIVDCTGLETLDLESGQNILGMLRATALLGARCFVCGVRPKVARRVAEVDVDLTGVTLSRTLRDALAMCR